MKEELLKGLTEEQIAKLKGCKNQEEMLALARNEGVELNNEQLEAISGGCGTIEGALCPRCGSNSGDYYQFYGNCKFYTCVECHCNWKVDNSSGAVTILR